MADENGEFGKDGLRILLIEDNPGDARLIREMLAEGGIGTDLQVSDRLAAGLDFCKTGQVDLVLLDLSLPDSHGLETVDRLKKECGDAPLVVLTGVDDDRLALESLQRGAQDYLAKGRIEADILQRTIRHAIQRQRLVSQVDEHRNMVETIVSNSPDGLLLIDAQTIIRFANSAARQLLGRLGDDLLGEEFGLFSGGLDVEELQTVGENGQPATIEVRYSDVQWHGKPMTLVALRDVTMQRQAEAALENRLDMLAALYRGAQTLSEHLDFEKAATAMVQTVVEVFGARFSWMARLEMVGRMKAVVHFPEIPGFNPTLPKGWEKRLESGCALATAMQESHPGINPQAAKDREACLCSELLGVEGIESCAAFPMISHHHTFGVLLVYGNRPNFFTPEITEFLKSYSHLAAGTLENARLLNRTEKQVEHLGALRNIDMAISSSLDLRVTLDVVLDNVQRQLDVDAATILLLEPHSQALEFGAQRGFRTRALKHTLLRTGEGFAGQVALKRELLHIPDLGRTDGSFSRSRLLEEEDFVTYLGVPLVAKGQIEGVLEIFHRSKLEPDEDWYDFLEALAGQAAIAIDNASLYSNLERANTELSVAYDATIEGWAKALDFRDKETEGHSRRVTELTERIAREVGIGNKDMIHVRRGALLHDIGKLGVPDSILLKPGKLTDEEWAIMKDHPNIAYQLLSPIAYLREAVNIPYCHHEKWDGSGYPRGLRGEEIPLPARIFAVVDVWDALLSDRPYRPAWPEEKVRQELQDQSGKHFDPAVVEVFLRMDWTGILAEE